MSKAKKSPKWLNGFTTFSSHERGFTLVELLVVISILAILAVIGIVVFSNITGSARDAKRKADIQAIAKTMEVNYNPGSGYQQTEGFNPPREGDYKIILGENNQSFLACTKLEKATETFCLRSTQGSDKYPEPDDDSEIASPVYSTPVTETTPDITTDLAGYWKLDEASGTRVDSKGTNDLTDNNTVTQTIGKISKAGQFTRANSKSLSIADNAFLSTGDIDFTIVAWVYLDNGSGNSRIVSKYPGGANSLIEYDLIHNNATNRFNFFVGYSDNTYTTADATTLGAVSTETWYMVTVWHDSINDQIGIAVNDGAADTVSTGGKTTQDLSAAFTIGNASTPAASYWDGRIDEVGFWKRVLTASERATLYNSGDGRRPSL